MYFIDNDYSKIEHYIKGEHIDDCEVSDSVVKLHFEHGRTLKIVFEEYEGLNITLSDSL